MAKLKIQLLGNFSVHDRSQPLTSLKSLRIQSLLVYLLLHLDVPQTRSHLAFLFWPDSSEAQARTNLRNLFHLLSKALPNPGNFLQADSQTLCCCSNPELDLDIHHFENSIAAADKADHLGDPARSCRLLENAINLYHGDLFQNCYEDWIMPERSRLRQNYLRALEHLLLLQEKQRDYESAIRTGQELLKIDSLNERIYSHLMRLYILRNDRTSALLTYKNCCITLQRELQVEPGAAIRQDYERLLNMESQASVTGGTPSSGLMISPLVGRHSEWDQLQFLWRTASEGNSHFVLLKGDYGIGKTRLMEEMFHSGNRRGVKVTKASCSPMTRSLAYAPVAAWLRSRQLPELHPHWLAEVARLLPEILVSHPGISVPKPLEENWQFHHFYESLAHAILSSQQPMMLFLDDMHWCDPQTLEWLGYFLHSNPGAKLLIIASLCSGEIYDNEGLVLFLNTLQRNKQLTEISLGALDLNQTSRLATNISQVKLTPALEEILYHETEGYPLLVVELMRTGFFSASVSTDPGSDPFCLPPMIVAMMKDRMRRLSVPCRELASLAATIGYEFSFQTLLLASKMDEDALVNALDELLHKQIVRENHPGSYSFSHEKLRVVAYSDLTSTKRQIYHRRVERALRMITCDGSSS